MSHSLFDVTGRRALVTGSSKGIGRALATGLLEAGCTVVLNGRDAGRLVAARRELMTTPGGEVHVAAFDVTQPGPVREGIERIEQEVGPLDIVVNNTGMQHRAPLLDFTDEDWRRIVDTNLTSA